VFSFDVVTDCLNVPADILIPRISRLNRDYVVAVSRKAVTV
jgi:hypothetical protein